MLQSLNLFWLYCLLRSAWKFISTGEKKDDRSEDEEEEVDVVVVVKDQEREGKENGVVKDR